MSVRKFKPGDRATLRRAIRFEKSGGYTTHYAGCRVEVLIPIRPDPSTPGDDRYKVGTVKGDWVFDADAADLEPMPGHTLELTPVGKDLVGGLADFLASVERGTVMEDWRVTEVDRVTGERKEVGRP